MTTPLTALPPATFAPGFPAPATAWALPTVDPTATVPDEIWEGWRVSSIQRPALGHYPAPRDRATGAAILICPGGGYSLLAIEHEGVTIARWANALGLDAFVLKYRLREHGHPAPLHDAATALRLIRAQAPALALDPRHLGVLGFSAGGHLAGTLATLSAHACARPGLALDTVSARPDFAVLIYGVLTLTGPAAHPGSSEALLGPNPTPDLCALLSPNEHITADTPPIFLVHSGDDRVVPVENSLACYAACRAAGVPAELHVFPEGGHGWGLKDSLSPSLARWPALCADWLGQIKVR